MLRAFACLAYFLAAGSVAAAPSSSCAGKFVGTWQHGGSNVATLTRDGQAICSGNAFCQQGTWSCSGNSLTYSNSAGTFVYTLQSSGVMTYGSIIVTRIGGGGPSGAKSASSMPPKAQNPSGAPNQRIADAAGNGSNHPANAAKKKGAADDDAKGKTVKQASVAQPQVKGANATTGAQNAQGDSNSSFNIPTPCQDLIGKFGCKQEGAIQLPAQRKLSESETQRLYKPRPWQPGGIAPDVQVEIAALVETVLQLPDNDKSRVRFVRALERRLFDHRVPIKQRDIDCLQAVGGVDQRMLDVPLRWHPEHIKKEAIDRSHLCDGVPEGDAQESCRESKYGQAVMWAEPELAAQCRGAGQDTEAVAECARRKFLNAWGNSNGVVTAPAPNTWSMPAICGANVPPVQRTESLRERLRAALAAKATGPTNDAELDRQGTPLVETTTEAPPAPAPPVIDEDEAYCNYMARELVRGALSPSETTALPPGCKATIAAAQALEARQGADKSRLFSMDADETDREIQRLLTPDVAVNKLK